MAKDYIAAIKYAQSDSTQALTAKSIPADIVFKGLTQDQVNAASTALGLPVSDDPRRNVRDILDLLVTSLEDSGVVLESYTAERDIEIIDQTSAKETYTFAVDMQISLVNPVSEIIPAPAPVVTTPDVAAPAPVVTTPDVPAPAPVVTAPTTSA